METMAMMSEFWKGKTVFLTGHTGFKGSWLSLWLQSLGAKVIGYSLEAPSKPNLFTEANVAQGMLSLHGDIRNLENLHQAISEHAPDIVIHMAAQSLVHYSYDNPVETYSTNVMGTVNLLESIRSVSSVKSVVIVTSDKCYENREWVWGYREDEAMGGYDPYSNSKGCAELVTSSYRNSFFNKKGAAVASARAGNVIGGGDWAKDRLLPDMIRAITDNEAVMIRRPDAIRPWQHVLEPLSGYLNLAQTLYEKGFDYTGSWNFGPNDDDAKPVKWIVDYFTNAWGDGAEWTLDNAEHPHEAHYLKLDCSKANALLNWQATWSLDKALDSIVDWHKAHRQDSDMYEFTIKQIQNFQEQAKL